MDEVPTVDELTPPDRTLMGPGPSDVHPRVLKAMSTPLVGHLDPSFIEIMDEVQDLLRYTFRTDNKWTIPVSGTGSAAMEAAIGNVVEPGDTMLVPTNGYFGDRMASMAERAGGDVVTVDALWGQPLDPSAVEAAFDEHSPDVFGFVHAETSTGVLQPSVPELTDIAHANDALVIADSVTSLGGVELRVDEWGIDVAYSGPQKCLSCPPGASRSRSTTTRWTRSSPASQRPALGTWTSRCWKGTGARNAPTITRPRLRTCMRSVRRFASSPRKASKNAGTATCASLAR